MSILHQPTFLLLGDDEAVDLPTVLARLWADDVEGFAHLQAFQEHAWHAFLTQLAALAVPDGAWPSDADGWRSAILELTDGAFEPWTLHVADLSKPAFQQLPVDDVSALKNVYEAPDEFDVPVFAKVHDDKPGRVRRAQADHWAYVLVSLQTAEGFSGRNNYGIVRMNGGLGNRPYTARAASLRWGRRVREEAGRLVANAASTAHDFGMSLAGHRLMWVAPWDGSTSIDLAACHPWCIETCRRVRLVEDDGRIVARTGNTTAPHIALREGGDVGDPWTPVREKDAKALTLASTGWRYDKMVELLTEYRLPPTLDPIDGAKNTAFVGRTLVRGQGKTEGFHERILPLPSGPIDPFRDPTLGDHAKDRREDVAKASGALSAGLRKFLAAGGDSPSTEDRHHRWLDSFKHDIDACFFPWLFRFAAIERDDDDARAAASLAWVKHLHDLARAQLDDCFDSAPFPEGRRLRAVASAESMFERSFRKKFPTLATESPR